MKRKITTKKGDKGRTNLYSGRRVDKDSLQVEALGSIDELNSYLGLLKAQDKRKKIKSIIENIQRDLFLIGAEVAVSTSYRKKLAKKINKKEIDKIERLIKDFEQKISLKKDFSLPGQNLASASTDIARVIARRAERRVVSLWKRKLLRNPSILIYLNRLSDLLFLLARAN